VQSIGRGRLERVITYFLVWWVSGFHLNVRHVTQMIVTKINSPYLVYSHIDLLRVLERKGLINLEVTIFQPLWKYLTIDYVQFVCTEVCFSDIILLS
jgi:hypothetical protein